MENNRTIQQAADILEASRLESVYRTEATAAGVLLGLSTICGPVTAIFAIPFLVDGLRNALRTQKLIRSL